VTDVALSPGPSVPPPPDAPPADTGTLVGLGLLPEQPTPSPDPPTPAEPDTSPAADTS